LIIISTSGLRQESMISTLMVLTPRSKSTVVLETDS
jgi:hypothetical protein